VLDFSDYPRLVTSTALFARKVDAERSRALVERLEADRGAGGPAAEHRA